MMLTFDKPQAQHRWYAVNDGVMGGESTSGFRVVDGLGQFHGDVSLANGGGFASVRREPDDFEPTLASGGGIALTVRGDGRTYQLRLKSTALGESSAYRVSFTPTATGWETLHFAWADFEAIRRGTRLPDAPALKPSEIYQLGFLIADRTAGPFCLQVKAIGAVEM